MRTPLTLAALTFSLAGCISFGAKPPPSLLTLSAASTIPIDSARTSKIGETLNVGLPIVPASYATPRVAVLSGDTAVAYVKDAVWAEPPARLFQRLLSETISAKTGRVILDPRQFAAAPGRQLTGTLSRFGVEAAGETGEAVIIFDAAISDDRGQTVRTRRFEARSPVAKIDATQSGEALNAAANRLADQVAAWVS